MTDFALIVLPGAYHSSVGALADSFALVRGRIEYLFSVDEPVSMETRLKVLSRDGGAVALEGGMPMRVDGAAGGAASYRFIWLPAFRAGDAETLGQRLEATRPLQAWLREQARAGAIIGASGAAATLLMAAGLTAGVPVPVALALQPVVRALFPRQPIEERLGMVDRGELLVANGIGNDLALIVRVMERTLSPDIARWLASVIGLDRVEDLRVAADPLVARAQLWLEQRFTENMRLGDLARALSTSQATLNRRFARILGLSPGAYVQRLRFEAACRMLEKSDRPVDRIAQLVGYSDSRIFRAMFQRQAGMTATQWRGAVQADPVSF